MIVCCSAVWMEKTNHESILFKVSYVMILNQED